MITFSNFNLLEDLEIHSLKPLQFKLKKSLLVKTNEEFIYKKEIYIPKGFITDGMSIPKWLQPVIGEPFEGNTLRAAIVHDYLCHCKCETQAFSHGIFREILKLDGVSAWRRNAAWLGVVSYNRLKNPKWK
ncbi:Campylobacter phage CGC-2007, Cje0229 [uncultured Caudovirales phage]|uniref:Campylobacter phage CGC-2007, Cje0229 n=1 Tax=uncultured Caudovirales phage TaxID=2100421 RepID=A0A6J5MBI1_9CAUD|nr:Campylobacter phage CGC-2007, Cje0229 [uncultured Caudovirales phage]